MGAGQGTLRVGKSHRRNPEQWERLHPAGNLPRAAPSVPHPYSNSLTGAATDSHLYPQIRGLPANPTGTGYGGQGGARPVASPSRRF